MIRLITTKVDQATIDTVASDLDGYIKVVIDTEKKILTAGGARHVDGEQLLLASGSRQEHLWGGGIDWSTKEIDYDSLINIRPQQGNTSREVLSLDIRHAMDAIIRSLFPL